MSPPVIAPLIAIVAEDVARPAIFTVGSGLAVSVTMPALPRFELASKNAPEVTRRVSLATSVMLPALPRPLLPLALLQILAFLPTTILLAATDTLPPSRPLWPAADSRPFTRATLPA